MKNLTLGSAPLLDFDGTIATLPVEWERLRTELGVACIRDLWRARNAEAWALVQAAEEEASLRAVPNPIVVRALAEVKTAAVLTNNSESSVDLFLGRFPVLARRVGFVLGRETLRGPKDEFDIFEQAFRRCVDATSRARGSGRVVYVGDRDYEVRYARRLGAQAWNVEELTQWI